MTSRTSRNRSAVYAQPFSPSDVTAASPVGRDVTRSFHTALRRRWGHRFSQTNVASIACFIRWLHISILGDTAYYVNVIFFFTTFLRDDDSGGGFLKLVELAILYLGWDTVEVNPTAGFFLC